MSSPTIYRIDADPISLSLRQAFDAAQVSKISGYKWVQGETAIAHYIGMLSTNGEVRVRCFRKPVTKGSEYDVYPWTVDYITFSPCNS